MKKRMTVLLAVVLMASLVLSACSGGSGNGNNGNTADDAAANTPANTAADNSTANAAGDEGSQEPYPTLGKEPLKFSYYVNYGWAAPIGYGSDATTKWLKEEKKIDIEEVSSNGNAEQKFGTMVASNQFPDVIQLDRGSKEFNSLVENGKLVALDEYLDKYPELKSLLDPETINTLRSPDGKLYAIPNWFNSKKNTEKSNNSGWLVNRKIHKELGSPALETFDDLYNFLTQVKAKYPDITPIDTGTVSDGNLMLQNFIYVGHGDYRGAVPNSVTRDGGRANLETKTVESLFDDPAYKESWQFVNKLFREKLLSQDALTQKAEQFTEKLNSGKIAILAINDATGYGKAANTALGENGYDAIPLIHKPGAANVSNSGYGTLGWNLVTITTSAKEPERIFEYLDWWASKEGQRIMSFGPPGLLYDEVDENGAPIDNEKAKSMSDEEKAALKLFSWRPLGTWNNSVVTNAKASQDPNNVPWDLAAGRLYAASNADINADQFNNFKSYDPNSDAGVAAQKIVQIGVEMHAKLLFAKTDDEFEKEYEAYRKKVEDAGYQAVLDFQTKTWEENRKKMGIE